jgi:hypothetical protein
MLRVGIIAVPIGASFVTAWILSGATPVPATFVGAVARWVLIAAAATVVMLAVERVVRRLAPLATLLALSLTFPDRAPPRFRVALRNGSTRQLRDRIEEARQGHLGSTTAEAAERVLELVAALSVHDRTTRGHSERVRAYSRMLGEELGLTDVELDQLQWAGLLHDIGKLLIPDAILNKPGKLTAAEYEEVCLHPQYGRDMVELLIPWLGESARAVWEHHERWEGGGYPAGLAGLDIALAARIVNVADTFDVITSARSYKEPVSAALARAELARCAGGQFDPVVVRAFLNISIGRLRLLMGPLSLLAQARLFPTKVLSGAAGGHAAILAATMTVVGATTFGAANPVATAAGRTPAVGHSANGSMVKSLEVSPRPMPTGWTTTTATVPGDDSPVLELATPPVDSPSVVPTSRGPIVPTTAAKLTLQAATRPSPSVPAVTLPSVPVVTLPSVPVADEIVVVPAPTTTTPPVATASRVDLGAASEFAVLAYAAVTSTGSTTINGRVGATNAGITGLLGTLPVVALTAQTGAATAQLFLTGLSASQLPGVELGGRTILPGVYHGGTIGLTDTVTLDAGGDPNALFVFKADSTLVTAPNSRVVLVNGARACNVFWQVGSSATLDTDTHFSGTIIAAVSITANAGVAVDGRLLAQGGAVTLISDTITVPACG